MRNFFNTIPDRLQIFYLLIIIEYVRRNTNENKFDFMLGVTLIIKKKNDISELSH